MCLEIIIIVTIVSFCLFFARPFSALPNAMSAGLFLGQSSVGKHNQGVLPLLPAVTGVEKLY